MLLACSLTALSPCSWEESLSLVQEAGLRQVAIHCPNGFLGETSRAADEFSGLLAAHSLGVAAVDLGQLPLEAAAGHDSGLQVAKLFSAGVAIISLEGHALGAPLFDKLGRLGEAAESLGLVIALDTTAGPCRDTRGMLMVLQAVNHPAVRLCFDTGAYMALNPSNSGEVALQRVCGQLGCVRLRDVLVEKDPMEFPPLGQGAAVDFARTLEILRPLRFHRPCIIDFSLPGRKPATRPTIAEALLHSVNKLRRCGWFDD